MADEILHSAALVLATELGIDLPERVSEEVLLRLLADKLATVIQQGQEPFYRLMYRLDVSEKKLNAVAGTGDVAVKVAKLVYDRQLAKAKARLQNRKQADDTDPELKW